MSVAKEIYDCIVIGGGQAGLACGYYLRRTDLNYLIVDAHKKCGGSWPDVWEGLHLFSAAQHSSLPGWLMPKTENEYPTKEEALQYLCDYEKRYDLPVKRGMKVITVDKKDGVFELQTASKKVLKTKSLIAATGKQQSPFIPSVKGVDTFKGLQLHSASFNRAEELANKKVLIVGEGNSGAQILAQVSKVAETHWAVKQRPEFLPDDVDGKDLFGQASAQYKAKKKGGNYSPKNYNLGSIVMVPEVRAARDRGVYKNYNFIREITETGVIWQNGKTDDFDVILWCTGFDYSTDYLKSLVQLDERGKTNTDGTQSIDQSGLWLVGFGQWTGYASATLIGVGRSAKKTIRELDRYIADLQEKMG